MDKTNTKILLVEDEPTLQYLVNRQLSVLGYKNIETAENGLKALEKLQLQKYNVILMDVMMPGLNGLLCTQQIRMSERELGTYTPIIGMTAFAESTKCFEAGMDLFLLKPVLLDPLNEALQKMLGLTRDDHEYAQSRSGNHPIIQPESISNLHTENKVDELRRRLGLN